MTIDKKIEKKAETDGQFAIAYALLSLGQATHDVARALYKLGLNNAATEMGAIEMLGSEIKNLVEAVQIGIAVRVESE